MTIQVTNLCRPMQISRNIYKTAVSGRIIGNEDCTNPKLGNTRSGPLPGLKIRAFAVKRQVIGRNLAQWPSYES